MRFLIDECLSPYLVRIANSSGYEAYHVAHRGWAGEIDSDILKRLIAEELVLVTNNRNDFLALVQGVELHPGLIVILENVRRNVQIELFKLVLEVISEMTSLINKVIEVSASGEISIYNLPAF